MGHFLFYVNIDYLSEFQSYILSFRQLVGILDDLIWRRRVGTVLATVFVAGLGEIGLEFFSIACF